MGKVCLSLISSEISCLFRDLFPCFLPLRRRSMIISYQRSLIEGRLSDLSSAWRRFFLSDSTVTAKSLSKRSFFHRKRERERETAFQIARIVSGTRSSNFRQRDRLTFPFHVRTAYRQGSHPNHARSRRSIAVWYLSRIFLLFFYSLWKDRKDRALTRMLQGMPKMMNVASHPYRESTAYSIE